MGTEMWRVFRPSGVCVRYMADGSIHLLGWNGACRTRDAAGVWRSTLGTGEQCIASPDLAPLPALVSVPVLDAKTGATMFKREDGMVTVVYPSGLHVAQHLDGTVIRGFSPENVSFTHAQAQSL